MSQLVICTTATYTITVTWTANDACNNSSQKTQTITVVPDTQTPSITVPPPLVLDCGDINATNDPSIQILDWLGSASASDNCDTDPELTYDFNMSELNICAPATYAITVTWTATDACNNSTQKTQTITVVPDTQQPTLIAPPNLTLSCTQNSLTTFLMILDWLDNYTVSDNCTKKPTVTYGFSSTTFNYCTGDDIVVTWTAMDNCGNMKTATSTLQINKDAAPILTCPADFILKCGPVVFGTPVVTDGCSPGITAEIVSTTINPGINGTKIHCRTWKAVDACGNTSTCSQCITVLPPLTVDAGPDKMVYLGFPDSACTKLQSTVTGGVPPRTLTWSNGSHAPFINVCPAITTVYYLTVTDFNNCTAVDSVTVKVIDVRCGSDLNNVLICHGTGSFKDPYYTFCEKTDKAKWYLKYHSEDRLGPCPSNKISGHEDKSIWLTNLSTENNLGEIDYLAAFPNPFSKTTTIRFGLPGDDFVKLRLTDVTGREIQILYNGHTEEGNVYQAIIDGSEFATGMYFLKLNTRSGINQVKKLILEK